MSSSCPYTALFRSLGFCGAPQRREDLTGESYGDADGENVVHRLPRLLGWLDHLVALGANVLLLNPIFDSVSHGRSEERRVGKECRSRWWAGHYKKKA